MVGLKALRQAEEVPLWGWGETPARWRMNLEPGVCKGRWRWEAETPPCRGAGKGTAFPRFQYVKTKGGNRFPPIDIADEF